MKYKIHCEPLRTDIFADQGETVLEALRGQIWGLDTDCSGNGRCGRCLVRLISGTASEISQTERNLLGEKKVAEGFRLACRLRPASDITIYIPGHMPCGNEKKQIFRMPENFIPERVPNDILGVAFDIGTTTVFAALCNLTTGEVICTGTAGNSQAAYGADVISRIEYCCRKENGTAELQKLILSDMNRLIRTLLAESRAESSSIYRVTVAGNTTMCHLLLGIKPEGLSKAPFTPHFHGSVCIDAGELALELNENAAVHVLPGIAGFIGSDITAVAEATGITELPGVTVAVDIGTNGEILAAKNGKIYACSTAAGPAFEGASIRCGMRAENGAICSVRIDDDVAFDTIGAAQPAGICGSGLIGLIAQMSRAGLISPSGVLMTREAAEEQNIPDSLKERLFREGKENGFMLSKKNDGECIALYQKDIREIQLAKAAIIAGIKTLLAQLNVSENEIDRLLLSGTFGNYIDPESAADIGLIPYIEKEKITAIGNGAGTGAVMALLSSDSRKKMDDIAENTQHIDLSKSKEFYSLFAREMRIVPDSH